MITESWIIGLCWSAGSICEDRFVIRSINMETELTEIAEFLDVKARPFLICGKTWNLKISTNHSFVKKLISLGWSGRKDKLRGWPDGDIDEAEFIRGYCTTRHSIDNYAFRSRGKRYMRLRMRIYGSEAMMTAAEEHFRHELDCAKKKLYQEKTNEGDTWALYYQARNEVLLITRYLGMYEKYEHIINAVKKAQTV